MATFVTIVMHHGGRFSDPPNRAYVGGLHHVWPDCDLKKMYLTEIWDMLKEIGYAEEVDCWWLMPRQNLDEGLRILKSNTDCLHMMSAVKGEHTLELFVVNPITQPQIVQLDFENQILEAECEDQDLESTFEEQELVTEQGNVEDYISLTTDVNWDDDPYADQHNWSDEYNLYSVPIQSREALDESYDMVTTDNSEDDDELFEPFTELVPGPEVLDSFRTSSALHDEGSEDEDDEGSEDLHSVYDSSDEDVEREKTKLIFPQFNENAEYGNIQFELGMEFSSLDVFKEAVRNYTIHSGRAVKFCKNDKLRCRAECKKPCPWKILCSWAKDVQSFQIKTFHNKHTCSRVLKVQQASSSWLARKLVPYLRVTSFPVGADIINFIKTSFNILVTETLAYRAWDKAKSLMQGSERDQYARLRDYAEELRTKGARIQVGVERPGPELLPQFDRLYLCFKACKDGFLAGCRPMIGLDGCFLKGYYGGILLAAVGQDGDNGFYPIAVAVVDSETKDTWTWFLTRLLEDIGPVEERGWCFISDKQKGLEPTFKELVPRAHQRYCVRHIWTNYAKKFKGLDYKNKLWDCARATTMQEFAQKMDKLKALNDKAWAELAKYEPSQWSRAAFPTYCKSQVLTNNQCEQFNSKILKFRGKPIISMLEDIRLYIQAKMNTQRIKGNKCTGPLCPKVQRRLDIAKKEAFGWVPIWAGDPQGCKFEVICQPEKYVVDLKEQTCACRVWDLTGIPCKHVVAALGFKNLPPEDYVHPYLRMDAFRRVYEPYIEPVNGPNLWPQTSLDPIQPPKIKRPPGRPKKQRKKDVIETDKELQDPSKLKRRLIATCSKCGTKGHNMRSCKGLPSTSTQKGNQGQSTQVEGSQRPQTETRIATQDIMVAASESTRQRFAAYFPTTQESVVRTNTTSSSSTCTKGSGRRKKNNVQGTK